LGGDKFGGGLGLGFFVREPFDFGLVLGFRFGRHFGPGLGFGLEPGQFGFGFLFGKTLFVGKALGIRLGL
jgi:hypothetical protein